MAKRAAIGIALAINVLLIKFSFVTLNFATIVFLAALCLLLADVHLYEADEYEKFRVITLQAEATLSTLVIGFMMGWVWPQVNKVVGGLLAQVVSEKNEQPCQDTLRFSLNCLALGIVLMVLAQKPPKFVEWAASVTVKFKNFRSKKTSQVKSSQ